MTLSGFPQDPMPELLVEGRFRPVVADSRLRADGWMRVSGLCRRDSV